MSTSTPPRIVIAPDSFKGTITAEDAARAIADGWRSRRPGDELVPKPMADGGEGTAAVAAASVEENTALVELAVTSGLALLKSPAPLTAGTYGFGAQIAQALDAGASRLLLAIGGSSSTDGGAGMLTALGARLLDADGIPVAPGAGGLLDLARVDLSGMRPLPPGGAVVLSDVDNPATGPRGAAAVFGPQKGLHPDSFAAVDAALARLAALLGVDPTTPGTGAAGATGLALAAWGATSASGARVVADLIGLPAAIAGATLVITGEGRFDGQTASGKVADVVARLAVGAGVPVALVAGSIEAPTDSFAAAADLTTLAGSAGEAMRHPVRWLREAGARLAERSASV